VIRLLDLVIRTLLKLLFVAAGLVLAVVLSAFGLAVALGVVAWQVLRGRPPQFRFKMKHRPEWRSGRRPAFRPRDSGSADVVDVEARDVTDRK